MRGRLRLDPRGLPGLIQPAGLMDAMQRLTLMMAVMILGAPQIYSCHVGGDLRMSGISSLSDTKICPMKTLDEEIKSGTRGRPSGTEDWRPHIARQCSQSSLQCTARRVAREQ